MGGLSYDTTVMTVPSGPVQSETPTPPVPTSLAADTLEAQAEKRWVAGTSILAALVVTALKLVVGLSTQSLGILSEAAHSALDLVAAVITFFSVRVSDKPADADHQYGHHKVENFSAFLETGLLLVTCVWIVREAARRLLFHKVDIEPSVWAFAVMLLSVAVDWGRSRALQRVALKYQSQALEADALHFATDVWSSLVVILGLVLVQAGQAYGVPELMVADPLAAIAVSGIVVHISVQLGKRTLDALLDAAPPGVGARLLEEVRSVAGVVGSDRIRVRKAGNRFFVDAKIAVHRTATFEQVKGITDAVHARIVSALPGADVMIHTEPRASRHENLFDKVKAVAGRHDVNFHNLSAESLEGGLHLELHLEVPDALSLRQAHELVSRIEEEILGEAPELASINTHIENAGARIEPSASPSLSQSVAMPRRLKEMAERHSQVRDCHDVSVRRVRGRTFVSCHILLDGEMPIAQVHDITGEIEAQFRREFPEIFHVIIHSEPE